MKLKDNNSNHNDLHNIIKIQHNCFHIPFVIEDVFIGWIPRTSISTDKTEVQNLAKCSHIDSQRFG